jgi:hypothetical protein
VGVILISNRQRYTWGPDIGLNVSVGTKLYSLRTIEETLRVRFFDFAERCREACSLRVSVVQPLSRLQHSPEDCHHASTETRAAYSRKFLHRVTGNFR